MSNTLFNIFIFPGFLFLSVIGLFAEYFDRKLYARMQNRIGPPLFQPIADFIKLLGKEDIIPDDAEPKIFKILPIIALTASMTAIFYIPIWSKDALFSFNGDIIVVLYLITIPTLSFFLAGWYSTSLYSMLGAVRALTQLFAYEVPLFMSILAPAIISGTWSISETALFFSKHPIYAACNCIGFIVATIAIQGKLEKVPFDIPEAETEIVGGTFTEYSGRLLAIFRISIDIEMVVCASLLAAVYIPIGFDFGGIIGFVIYLLKLFFVIALFSLIRTLFARLRIEQMIKFCWKYLAPAALLQIIINIIIKGAFLQ